MKRKKNNQPQSTGKTQISIALPKILVDRIDAQAALENRNRSNFIATSMEQLMDQIVPMAAKPVKAVIEKPRKVSAAKAVTKKLTTVTHAGTLRKAASGKINPSTRKRHTPDEIKSILEEVRNGATTAEVCETHGIGYSTLFRWKNLYRPLRKK